MTPDASRVVDVVASSVADGSSIDWERSSAGLVERDRRLVSNLRVIEAVSQVYRSLTAEEPDAGGEEFLASNEPVGPRWGRLVLLDRIGRGASADVFRAWDVDLEREVALKLLVDEGMTGDAAANARLLREARRLARVRHPHVVSIHGAERHEGRIGLWMELVRGRTLADVVQNDGALPPAAAAAAAADICGAVSAVHAAGLLHRDVKAQNVVREDGGRLVLMDLGAGAEIGAQSGLAGTPIYLAPEVLDGTPASIASDTYSLGVLLFFLITGRYPVTAASMDALLAAHRERNRVSIGSVAPSTLARIVERALNPNPAQRFASAADMETALRAFLAPSPTRGPVTWKTWTAVAATAAVVVSLVGTVASWRRTPAASPATSIAVLPLTSSSSGADTALVAEGLTDELITKLGQVPSLRVTAHTSVRRFTATAGSVSEIASQLHVGTVLEGSVAVDSSQPDPRVHVNLRLIRAGTDVELWSDSFDRPLRDLTAVEEEIASAVTRGVHATLAGTDSKKRARAAQHDPRAQQAYLEALSYLAQNRQGKELQPVLETLQRAVAIDEPFAAPHAALARTYVLLGFGGEMPQADAYSMAKREALRALQLDPSLADAHTALADISFYYEWNWAAADASYREAIALEPSHVRARTQFAQLLAALGRTQEADAQVQAAVASDPLNADVAVTEGLMNYYERRFDTAAAVLQRALNMDPRFPGAYLTLSRVQEARGDFKDAARLIDRALTIAAIPAWRADRIRVRALAGETQDARIELRQLKEELAARNLPLDEPHEAYVELALGERDRAVELLSNAVAARAPSVLWLAVDPRVDAIRNDPRFAAMVAHLGRP